MANLVKIWWTTKLLTRNLMDSSYILFSGTPNPSSFCIHTLLYRVIVNSAAKLQSGCDKKWHREKKNEEGRLNCRWNTICILPRKEYDLNSDNSIIFTFETAISEKQEAHKQIKKLKLANKQADIQAFLLPLHSKPPFPKQRFRKITSKRNCKIIEIWSSLEDKTK